jgi:hypothetical protein
MKTIFLILLLTTTLAFSAGNQFYSVHLTANGTTNVTSVTTYLKSMQITCSAAGTTETLVVQSREATPKILFQSGTLAVGNVVTFYFDATAPIQVLSGIQIVYAGTTAGVVDAWITYE